MVHQKWFHSVLRSKLISIVFLFLFGVAYFNQFSHRYEWNKRIRATLLLEHERIVDEFYAKRKAWNTSNLGEILFKNKPFPKLKEEQRNTNFTILIYKRWNFLKRRHVYNFGSKRHDPLEGCSVRNCRFVGNDSYLDTADAVIVHLHTGFVPNVTHRNRKQRWIFLNDEAPVNALNFAKHLKLSDIYDIFNWSMTYRTNSDVPVPYGHTVALKSPRITNLDQSIKDLIPNWGLKSSNTLIAILVSNCFSYRNKIISEIKKYLPLHYHGRCGDEEFKNSCPGYFASDCEPINQYLFYLALENTKCKEYITEKVFYNAYLKGAIPIIQGPSLKDCEGILPPNSYLHIDNYKSIKELAEDVINISKDEQRLISFHQWRNNFHVSNDHGFFGSRSYHLCRVCEAMNYNDKRETVYRKDDIERFLDGSTLCRN